MRHLLAMTALLGGLGTVCCLSAVSQELMVEEGNLVPPNRSSQDLDNPIDDILEEIARLKEDNRRLNDVIRNNFAVTPIGTITAWVTKPTKGTREDEMDNLPEGWVRCSG